MPLLRLKNTALNFGNLVLLDGVDLNIFKGDKIGLLGRNGAGKTTLLKILAENILPDGGGNYAEDHPRSGPVIFCGHAVHRNQPVDPGGH